MKKVTFATKRNQPVQAADPDQWVGMANKPTPGEPIKRLTIDVPLSLHQRIKYTCALEGVIMADVIRDLLIKRFPERK